MGDYLEVDHGAEGTECFDLFLDFGSGGAEFIELLQEKQAVADRALEQNVEWHEVEV